MKINHSRRARKTYAINIVFLISLPRNARIQPSPRGTRAEISKGSRILNAQNTFQDFVPDFCATQISDFRSQNWPRFLISDFRHRISDPRKPATPRQRFRFQKTDFKGAGPDPTGFRFQISDLSAEQADVASPLHISECRIQIPGTKKYRLEGPRRRPDNIGQIPMEKMLSPVLGGASTN